MLDAADCSAALPLQSAAMMLIFRRLLICCRGFDAITFRQRHAPCHFLLRYTICYAPLLPLDDYTYVSISLIYAATPLFAMP